MGWEALLEEVVAFVLGVKDTKEKYGAMQGQEANCSWGRWRMALAV